MGFLFYQPSSKFREANVAAAFLAYAAANLPFFAGPWLSQFVPNSALAVLWPGEKLAAIILELTHLQKQGFNCCTVLAAYKNIYRQLTLTDFPADYSDTYIYYSTAAKGDAGAGSFLPSTLGNATGRHNQFNNHI